MRNYNLDKIERLKSNFRDSEFGEYLESFRFDCQIRNLTDKTISVYLERLNYLFKYLQMNQISFNELNKTIIQDYILYLKNRVSIETINGRIRVYRRFFNFLIDEKFWDDNSPMANIKLLKTEVIIKQVIEPEIIQKIIRSISKKTYEGNRNRIMILLFWDGMLRLNELLNLKYNDFEPETRLIKVYGKGRKERMVPLGLKTIKSLRYFIKRWRKKYSGEYLVSMRNGFPLSERHCHKIVQSLGKNSHTKLYPHLIRHSAATWYIQQGGNPVILQRILGHSSLSVTQRYLHLSNEDAINSYDSFSPSNCLKI